VANSYGCTSDLIKCHRDSPAGKSVPAKHGEKDRYHFDIETTWSRRINLYWAIRKTVLPS